MFISRTGPPGQGDFVFRSCTGQQVEVVAGQMQNNWESDCLCLTIDFGLSEEDRVVGTQQETSRGGSS